MVYGRTPFQNVPNKIDAIINPNHSIDFPDKGDPALMDVLKVLLIIIDMSRFEGWDIFTGVKLTVGSKN